MESQHLLEDNSSSSTSSSGFKSKLSVFFATLCIIDVFGVFPIITLPGALLECGLLGFPVVAAIFLTQIYTAKLLGRSWLIAESLPAGTIDTDSRYPYAALAHLTLGETIGKYVAVLVDLTVFSAGIPNLIVAAQTLQALGLKATYYEFNFSYCYWILILGLFQLPILWLGTPKDMKCISVASVVVIIITGILILLCVINDPWTETRNRFPRREKDTFFEETTWRTLLSTYGLIAFQFDIHPLLLNIQVDMHHRRKISRSVLYAFIFTLCLFLTITFAAFLKYGPDVSSNILHMLPASWGLFTIQILVILQLCFTSAISNTALFQDIEDYLKIPRGFNLKRCWIRSTIMIIAIILSEIVPRFEIAMSLIGGTLTGPLMFILPALFFIQISKKDLSSKVQYQTVLREDNILVFVQQSKISMIWKQCDYYFPRLIVVFGGLITVLMTIMNLSDTIRFTSYRPPCIYNFTAASYYVVVN